LLSDFHPQGKVLGEWGLLNEASGTARRSAIIVDKDGVVRWAKTYEPGLLPAPNEVLDELAKLV